MKKLFEQNHYQDTSFPFEIYHINQNGVKPSGRGFDDAHWHDELQFTIVEKGVVNAKINGVDYILNKGDFIFINSNVLHQMTQQTPNSSYISINFIKENLTFFPGSRMDLSYVEPYVNSIKYPCIAMDNLDISSREILSILKEIIDLYYMEPRFGREYLISIDLCKVWLILIISKLNQIKQPTTIKNTKINQIMTMIQFIYENYADNIALADISSSSHISNSEANRLFKKYTSMTPYKFLIDYRLQRSQSLLENKNLTVTEISQQIGFSDTSHFIQSFKKKYGRTPGSID